MEKQSLTMRATQITAVIQARMNSQRLPGKVMMDMCGRPMLAKLVERVRNSKLLNNVIVATTELASDDILEELAFKYDFPIFRGSEKNVLERVTKASELFASDVTVRLTADNPFVNGELVDIGLAEYLRFPSSTDYVSNTEGGQFPIGLYVEVINTNTLKSLCIKNLPDRQLEHVTLYIRENRHLYNTKEFYSNYKIPCESLTIDTFEEYQKLSILFSNLCQKKKDFGLWELSNISNRDYFKQR